MDYIFDSVFKDSNCNYSNKKFQSLPNINKLSSLNFISKYGFSLNFSKIVGLSVTVHSFMYTNL